MNRKHILYIGIGISTAVVLVLIISKVCGVSGNKATKEKQGSKEIQVSNEKATSTVTINKQTEESLEVGENASLNVPSGTPLANHGQLSVSQTNLVDCNGTIYQLRGVSTHGLAWYPQYVSYDTFKTLRDDWGANVIRLAMYTEEVGGYCNGGDKNALKQLIRNGVKYATELGMYVIIDWHILSDFNPQMNKIEAIAFFDEMATEYAGCSNVIYEICNEPQQSSWANDIKPYAEEVISTIRNHDSNAIVLVGTNTWSQDVEDVIGNKINDNKTMYVLHFYAGTHFDIIRNKLITAKSAGVPLFVSECSICDASGNGGINYDSASTWLKLLNENNISFIAWSLSNKNESSALLNPGCSTLSGWTEGDLSDTGKWFKNAIDKK